MRHPIALVAALVTLTAPVPARTADHSACRQALQSLGSAASSASFEASRAESDCRDADSSCRTYQSCQIVPGEDVTSSCQLQRTACESGSQRCRSAETSLDRSVGIVQSAMSTVQLSCR